MPAFASSDNGNDDANYWDGAPSKKEHGPILGSTTLHELIQRVKKNEPGLYLWDEIGGEVLTCGPHLVYQSEWESTMIWELISEESSGSIPRVMLEDGREAIVVTIGAQDTTSAGAKATVVQRCLAKGETYG